MSQTTIQNQYSIRAGDGIKLELDAGSGWVDVGAILGDSTVSILADTTQTKNTNVGPLDRKARNQRAEMSINSLELDLENWNLFLGSLSTYSTVAGTPVVGGTGAVTFTEYLKPVELPFQEADGTAPTITAASGSVDVGPLVENTDYVLVEMTNGRWGAYLIDSATVTTAAQTVTFTASYTPAAEKVIDFGATITTLASLKARVTFVDNNNGDTMEMTFWKVYNTNGLPLNFVGPETTDEMTVNVTFEAVPDVTKADGEQIAKIRQIA